MQVCGLEKSRRQLEWEKKIFYFVEEIFWHAIILFPNSYELLQ